jgi:hypothetical protein
MIDYTIIYSKRKTVAIYVRDGFVEVRAPRRVSKRFINEFVQSKEKWILNQLEIESEQIAQRKEYTLSYGDAVAYRGKQYIIAKSGSGNIGVSNDRFYIPSDLKPEQIKVACVQLYRILAKSDLMEKVNYYADRMGLNPVSVRINSAKTRWGSCSAKKAINFSWRLIMADDDVINYVVVHELAHLVELNHSKRFWTVVERVLPDYKERQVRLKELQKKLSIENWED